MDVVKTSSALLRAHDSFWGLEGSMLRSLCGATAEQRAASQILAELPTKERDVVIADALARLQALAASPANKLSPQGVQAALTFIVKHLKNLGLGISITEKMDQMSALARRALFRFQLFSRPPAPTTRRLF